jgi:O-antigen ligase
MFLTDIDHYVEIYGKGQILPTPIHHIRYSILVSLAVLFCIYLFRKKDLPIVKFERKLIIGIGLFLIIYLHVLAVRSGLMTTYVMLLCLLFFIIKEKGSKKMIISLATGLILTVFIAINFVPTIKNKISYMKYSLELFSKNENIRELSDSRRLGSIYAGIQLTKSNPFLGVGIGDIMDETNAYLSSNYPELTGLELLPHNQYILTSASLGITGLMLFIIFTIMPFFYLNGYNDFLLFSSQLMFFASFMVEHTIESQIGVAVYIFILLFAMKNIESLNTSSQNA